MGLTKITDLEYVDFEAVVFAQFFLDGDLQRAVLHFAEGGTHTVEGKGALALHSLIQEEHQATEERGTEICTASAASNSRSKAWFYKAADDSGREVLIAVVNKGASCSLRAFDAKSGIFLRKHYRPGSYQEQFAGFLANALELSVASHPNLERDCRERLPQSVLAYLREQIS